jgi:Xaa-Pro aminopeptidase
MGTLGTFAVDREQRADFDRMRAYRVSRVNQQLEKYKMGAILCFDMNNIRYITSTTLGAWAKDKMTRYCLLPRGGQPHHWDMGSAARVKEMLCPWLRGRVRPAISSMRGAVPVEIPAAKMFAGEIYEVLKDYGLHKEPLGVDVMDMQCLQALQALGLNVVDGTPVIQDAKMIKSPDEILMLEHAASLVDAAYDRVHQFLRPGVRECELVGLVHERLYALGSDDVEAVNCLSGPRTNPHAHDFSDRIIRPGDMVFMDIIHSYNGYRTCYYRTFVVGKSTQKQRDIYQQCWDWLRTSIEAVRPGATTAEIAAKWPKAPEFGYKDEKEAFALQFGHGIGTGLWEKPVITRLFSMDHPYPIEENMVFALETWFGETDGFDGARIEEECVVTKTGCEVITKFPCSYLVEAAV